MIIIKFGGRSLGTIEGLRIATDIVLKCYVRGERPVVVVSARGKTTDLLIALVDLAKKGLPYSKEVANLFSDQNPYFPIDFSSESNSLLGLLEGISLLGVCPPPVLDQVLSFGELVSAKVFVACLQRQGIDAFCIDAGDFLRTDDNYGDASILPISERLTAEYFSKLPNGTIPVVTGFIARTEDGSRTTLGRNGSNYTATLLADYLEANRVDNYTHVDGIYTANPDLVFDAHKIGNLTYSEAAELAQYGADILHHKTVDPLVKKGIPLRILNTFSPEGICQQGTVISNKKGEKSAKALATIKGRTLVYFEGHDMKDRPGLDARIFGAMLQAGVSVSLITQGSSERGTGLVVADNDTIKAKNAFDKEFQKEIEEGLIRPAQTLTGQAVVALIGVPLTQIDRPYGALIRHGIIPKMVNSTVPSGTLCLVLSEAEVPLALNVMHSELFDKARKIHLAIVGHGNVGGTLIDQLIRQREDIKKRKNVDLVIYGIAGSQKALLLPNNATHEWRNQFAECPHTKDPISLLIRHAKESHLENLIFIDNTASQEVAARYPELVNSGFDLVSSNKIGNVDSYIQYTSLRNLLEKNRKSYRYETNVGAGLPLIDFLKLLHLSGDKVTAIRGLFSGSLGYILTQVSDGVSLGIAINKAIKEGYTEPDPRIDLSGIDVARKLLILARELDIPAELSDVSVESLVHPSFANLTLSEFQEILKEPSNIQSTYFQSDEDTVLRYVGSIVMPQKDTQIQLRCSLEHVSNDSILGQTTGADSCFEIYTENYGTNPIIIRGAGAGAEVTAQGVFSDILRTAERHKVLP